MVSALNLLTRRISFAVTILLQDISWSTEALVTTQSVFTYLVTNSPHLALIKIYHMENKHLRTHSPVFLEHPLTKTVDKLYKEYVESRSK